MLRFLTDSHVPPAVCDAFRKICPGQIVSLRDWHGGGYLHELDPKLLQLAWEEGLTIVTYDVNTFPLHVKTRLENGFDHAGVVYVSRRFRQNSIGVIARALHRLWTRHQNENWTNRIHFLQ